MKKLTKKEMFAMFREIVIANGGENTELLTGFMDIDEILQDYSDGDDCTVKILTAGSIPPNPSELLGSEKMR